ncbi:hypothetical protein [Rhodoligotrophos ferricapiens]|uniref:hypothetical protein n=1 Tax=Rhodoligotrophos ferricapiens TaxID=3069264 RepID=UPI00315CEA38
MAGWPKTGGAPRGRQWRTAGWALAALLLLTPWIAMQFSDEVNWSGADFAIAGALILATGVTFEVAARLTCSRRYRAAVSIALAAAVLLIWINGAVGIIGSEENPANLLYAGVLAIGLIGAIMARFRASGMARALLATAIGQALVGAIALASGLGSTAPSFPEAIMLLTGFFGGLWLVSAYLFRKAALH